MISLIVRDGFSGGSAVIAVASRKYFSSVPSKQSNTVKCDLSGMLLALARAAPQHLLEQDAGLDRPQEDDELQVGNVHAGGQQVHRDHDAGLRAVAELADLLQRPIRLGPVIFRTKPSPRPKTSTASSHQLVGVRRVRQVVGGEDQRLGEPPVPLLRAPGRTS